MLANTLPATFHSDRQTSRFYALHAYRRQVRASGALKNLSQSAALVLLALADFADPDGLCWPSVGRIVAENPVSEASVRRALLELEAAGLVVREERSGRSNLYRIMVNDVPATPATPRPRRASYSASVTHAEPQNKPLEQPRRTEQQQAPTSDPQQLEPAKEKNVVVPSLPVTNETEPRAPQEAHKLPLELYQNLKAIGIRAPWKIAHFGEERIREVLMMASAGRCVRNRAGFVLAALRDGWSPIEKASLTPGSGARLEAVKNHIQQHEAHKAQLADPEQAKRSRLALVVGVIQVRRPSPDQLAALLGRHHLTHSDLEAYLAEKSNELPS